MNEKKAPELQGPAAISPRRDVFLCAALALLTLIVFWPVFRCEFTNYDDPVFVTENHYVMDGLTAPNVKWAFTTSAPDYWRPLSWLSHQLDCQMFGLSPAGHHGTNLLLHIASTMLLFLALRKMIGHPWPSAWVAALFAVHPLHVESVAWVAERKDVLCAFFWMLTLLAYGAYAQQKSVRRYLAVLFCFILALMSKPMAVTLPFVLLLLDFWPLRRLTFEKRTLLRLVAEKIPMLALALVLSVVAVLGQKEMGVVASLETVPVSTRLVNAMVAYGQYLKKTFWPTDLAVFYPHSGSWPTAQIVLAAALLLAISVAAALEWRKRPYLLSGWLWFLGTLVPTIGFVQVGSQAMADRYTYLPLVGLFIMLAGSDAATTRPSWRPLVAAAAVTTVLASSVVAWRQVQHWRSSVTLFQHTLAVTTNNTLAHLELGDAFMRLGRLPEAEEQLAIAVRLSPNHEQARCNYAIVLANGKKYSEALEQLNEALRVRPDYPEAHAELAIVLSALGREAEATGQYRETLRLKPNFPEALNNLAWIRATSADDRLRDGPEAVRLAERACTLTRWHIASMLGTLAAAYAEAGRFDDAVAMAERARALATAHGQNETATRNQSLSELYRTHRAYHEERK